MNKCVSIYRRVCRWKDGMVYTSRYRAYGPKLPLLTDDRRSFEDLLTFMLDHAVKHYYSPESGYFKDRAVLQRGSAGKDADKFEFFARTLIGLGYHVVHHDRADLRDVYMGILKQGIDPDSPIYWGHIEHRQILVENTSLIIAFLLNPEKFWRDLPSEDQRHLVQYIRQCSAREFLPNNWLWFRLFHFLFLEIFDGDPQPEVINETMKQIDRLYAGDGWYRDGLEKDEECFDYYNAWAFHYYGLLFCKLAPHAYDEYKGVQRDRFKLFFESFRLCLSHLSLPIPWGRSLIYRFAMLSCVGLAVEQGLIEEKDWPWVKGVVVGNVNRFLEEGIFDQYGVLTMGFTQPSGVILEPYSADGSPYWALKFFSFLLLDPQHPFWKVISKADVNGRPLECALIGAPNIYISSEGDGHNLMLNGGVSSKRYAIKYNRTAYSNRFPQTFDGSCLDNSIVFYKGLTPLMRDEIKERKISLQRSLQFRWGVSKIRGLQGQTTLIPVDGGYCVMSQITTKSRIKYKLCGFGLPLADKEGLSILRTDHAIEVRSSGRVSRLTMLEGDCRPGAYKIVSSAKTLNGKRALVPYFIGYLNPGSASLVYYVQASESGRIPTVEICLHEDGVEISGKVYPKHWNGIN